METDDSNPMRRNPLFASNVEACHEDGEKRGERFLHPCFPSLHQYEKPFFCPSAIEPLVKNEEGKEEEEEDDDDGDDGNEVKDDEDRQCLAMPQVWNVASGGGHCQSNKFLASNSNSGKNFSVREWGSLISSETHSFKLQAEHGEIDGEIAPLLISSPPSTSTCMESLHRHELAGAEVAPLTVKEERACLQKNNRKKHESSTTSAPGIDAFDLLVSAAVVVFGNKEGDGEVDRTLFNRAGANRSGDSNTKSAIVKRKVLRRARSAFISKQNSTGSSVQEMPHVSSGKQEKKKLGSEKGNDEKEVKQQAMNHCRQASKGGVPLIQLKERRLVEGLPAGFTNCVLQSLQKVLKSKMPDVISNTPYSNKRKENSSDGAMDPLFEDEELESKEGDFEESSSHGTENAGISRAPDMPHAKDGEPIIRTKRGRSQVLPSKFSDSVLQPWKKRTRSRVKSKVS